jgi:phosphatidate cytidylyltransferase
LSNLLQRIAFAVPAAILFIFLTWMGGWYFTGMIILIGFFIQHEMIRILDKAYTPVDLLFPYTIGLWVMLSHELPYAMEIGLGIFSVFIALQTFNRNGNELSELTSTFFAGLYAPVGLLCLMMINTLGSHEEGFVLTIILMLMVWGSDVFAYFGGKTFGKHKLAPEISPNKTWEGFFSGYAGSFVGAYLVVLAVPFESPLTLIQLIPMSILVATFGPIGDLLESKLKRRANVKDSSSILPGHGGFFDRFDAVLLAAPVAFVYLKVLEALGLVSF